MEENSITRVRIPPELGHFFKLSSSDRRNPHAATWYNALDADRLSLVIALDIAGAFDYVGHRGLTAKLEQMVIARDLLHLFSSYLSDNAQLQQQLSQQ